jgi:hypothetical protein
VTEVAVATLPVETVKVAEVDPCAMVTLEGTLATDVFVVESEMVAPPLPAGSVKLTVPVPDCPLAMALGVTETVLSAPGNGFTVTLNVAFTPE